MTSVWIQRAALLLALALVALAPRSARADDDMPQIPVMFTAPTGRLLPASVVMGNGSVDTGGGLSGDLSLGLGDVAEFGLGLTDTVRSIDESGAEPTDPKTITPYPTATFKMGVAEDRLFLGQPALALGFRKSFERSVDFHKTRTAELYLVATKSLGPRAALHVGGVFWDASIHADDKTDPANTDFTLHEKDAIHQIRPFGGIEVEPLKDAKILLELTWSPEFIYRDINVRDTIRLRPTFSWGVRYRIAKWAAIESGVRVLDIDQANLLDAQIFGRLKIISGPLTKALRHR